MVMIVEIACTEGRLWFSFVYMTYIPGYKFAYMDWQCLDGAIFRWFAARNTPKFQSDPFHIPANAGYWT